MYPITFGVEKIAFGKVKRSFKNKTNNTYIKI